MDPRWLLRLSLAARRKHSTQKIVLILAIVGICLTLWAVERTIGWPEALSGDWVRPPARVN